MRAIAMFMLIIAVIYFLYVITHPEFGSVFYIGTLPIGSAVLQIFYGFYIIVMIGLFIGSCFIKSK